MKLPVVEDQDRKDLWYKDGLNFQCTCSGNCCTGGPGYVWISDEEISRLADHLSLDRDTVLRRYTRKIGSRISLKELKTEGGLYDCIFLTQKTIDFEGRRQSKRVCGIYPARPLQCRTWPFWDGLLETPEAWNRAARMCPGINRGKHYPLEKIEPLRTATDWPEESPGSK